MKKLFTILSALALSASISNAQTTAMQFSGLDCNGNSVDLYADLNAGKAVVLFYYMPNCGTCPPQATKIQTMVNNLMVTYPGMIKGYAFPFQNNTTCSYSQSWVTNNNLNFYAPMDSGATQVAYYGGFGMPTVVLVGGADHRVLFSTLSFTSADTLTMHDSIVNLLGPAAVQNMNPNISSVNLFPNPANQNLQIEMNIAHQSDIKIEVVNVLGETVREVYNASTAPGVLRKEVATGELSNGAYFIRVSSDYSVQNYKFSVAH